MRGWLSVTVVAVIAAVAAGFAARGVKPLNLAAENPPAVAAPPVRNATLPAAEVNLATALEERRRRMLDRIAEDPTDVPAYLALGDVQLRLGETDKARRTFEQAFRIQPDSTGALYGLAESCRVLGDHPSELAALRRLQQLRPADPGLMERILAAQSAAAVRKVPE